MIQYKTKMQASIEERLQQIKQTKSATGGFLRWSEQKNDWVPFAETFACEPAAMKQIATLTHNVLTDKFGEKQYKPHVIHSKERYTHILKDLGGMLPDIISFNQVTKTFNGMLRECQWAKENYWISQFTFQQRKGFGNLLLSKIKPVCLELIKVERLPRPIPTGFFHFKNQGIHRIFTFSSVHLISLSTNHKIRVEELTNLRKSLSKFDKLVDGHVLQGDMNFHSEQQNKILPQLKLTDAWLQMYNIESDPGYTFDTKYNKMINEIYWGFEGRRMRLDRVFYDSSCLQVQQFKVIFDFPIVGEKEEVQRNGFFKGGIAFLADELFGKNAFREKEKYLYRSDHFGLVATLSISQ